MQSASNTQVSFAFPSFSFVKMVEPFHVVRYMNRAVSYRYYNVDDEDDVGVAETRYILSCVPECNAHTFLVVVDKNVTEIRTDAFSAGQYSISTIQFDYPSHLQCIRKLAFYSFRYLRKIGLPTGLRIIEDEAFSHCTSLVEIYLPSTVQIIGKKAFFGCGQIHQFNMPSELEEIGHLAFCESLERKVLTIPVKVITVGVLSFGDFCMVPKFCELLCNTSCRLQRLDLSCQVGNSILDSAFRDYTVCILINAMLNNNTLLELGFESNGLSNEHMKSLVDVIPLCPKLQGVYLQDNEIEMNYSFLNDFSKSISNIRRLHIDFPTNPTEMNPLDIKILENTIRNHPKLYEFDPIKTFNEEMTLTMSRNRFGRALFFDSNLIPQMNISIFPTAITRWRINTTGMDVAGSIPPNENTVHLDAIFYLVSGLAQFRVK